MSGDDVANIERMLAALQLSFDEHLRWAEEREAKRERDRLGLEARVSVLESQQAAMPEVMRTVLREELEHRTLASDAEQLRAIRRWIMRTFAMAASTGVLGVLAYVAGRLT